MTTAEPERDGTLLALDAGVLGGNCRAPFWACATWFGPEATGCEGVRTFGGGGASCRGASCFTLDC